MITDHDTGDEHVDRDVKPDNVALFDGTAFAAVCDDIDRTIAELQASRRIDPAIAAMPMDAAARAAVRR